MGISDAKNQKFYLRLPERIVDEQQIKDLHPAIVKVTLPRQKSRRWCTVELSLDHTKSVLKELREIKVNGKKIRISILKKREKQ